MSDTQVLGAFALIAVACAVIGMWLNGRSPMDLYRDEPAMSDEQRRAIELALAAKLAPFRPRDPHAHSNLSPGYNKNFTDRNAS